MKLTQHTDYGLRVLLFLAANPDEVCSTRRMADFFGVSQNHLAKVIQHLVAAGYIETQRGLAGGARLVADPGALSVGDVVRALEPGFELVECFTEDGACPITEACGLAPILDDARRVFLEQLDRHTVASLVRPRSALARQLRAR